MSEEPEHGKSGKQQGGRESAPSRRVPAHWPSFAYRHALLVLWLSAMALMLMGGTLWLAHYLESPAMHLRARQFAVARLEQATGGRVELAHVGWSLHRLEFELDGLTIHGTEAAGEAPLLRVERVQGQLRWSGLLSGHLTLRRLRVAHPLAHVIVYKDGSTNLPEAKPLPAAPQGKPLLRLSVDNFEMLDGELDWNQRKIPLNGVAQGVFVQLAYDAAEHGYDGKARVEQATMRMPQAGPLALSADAQFRLFHNRVEVQRLRVNERGWVVEASGVVDGLSSPVIQLSYRASGSAAELAKLLRYRELKSGALQLSGQATYRWASGEYNTVGKAQASDVDWRNSALRLEKINGGMAYSADRDHFDITSLFAAVLGGTVHGKMEISHEPDKEPAGRLELTLTGVNLERTLRAFSTRTLPLERLPLAGQTDGPLVVSWRGKPQNAVMEADLQVRPVTSAGRLPLTASIGAAVNFRNASVELRTLDARTPGSSLAAEGVISENSNLKVDVRTSELAELKPLVLAWRGERALDLPIEFAGSAAFDGTLQGRLRSPDVAGHLELRNFTTVLRVPAKLATGATAPVAKRVVRTHWDLLQGDVWYSANGESLRNGLLQHGPTTLHVDASVGLENGSYNASLPFSAHVKVSNAKAEQLQRLIGVRYPVTGLVNVELRISGTAERLSGSGRIAMTNGTAWRQTLRLVSADLELARDQAGNEAQLRNIVVQSDAMRLTGSARMNLDTSQFAFALKGSDVRLEKLRLLAERKIPLTGVASFQASGEGTPSAPVIDGRLSLRDLTYRGQAVGGMDVQAVTHGASMKLTARSSFKDAELTLDGEVELRGQMPMHLTGDLQSAKLSALLASYLPVRLESPSEIQVHLEASGEAKNPRAITAQLDVERLTATYEGITVGNDGVIRLKVDHELMRVEQFRLVGEGGSRFLRASGEVHLNGQREINLRMDGNLNLKLLETANPNLMASGVANLNLHVGGTLDHPSMFGQLLVQNGSLNYINFPNGLNDINGSLVFSEDRLQLENLTARTGGGLLHCTGFLTYSPSQGLGFSLSAGGSDIRLRYPQGLSSTADARLTLSGTSKNALLSGEVAITRVAVNPNFNFATYLAKGVSAEPVMIESPLNALHLDVRVTSAQELQAQTSLARLSGNLDLRLRGTAARPVVLGRVNLLEGQVEFNGTKYRLERGDITFTNPVRIEPTIDMELSTRVRDYDITLGFHGPIDKLTTTYRSDPPLSSGDIISLLALGVTQEEQANPAIMGSAQYQPSVTASASAAVIGQALNATVSSRVQKLFGVSRVKINPNVGEELGSAGLARVTVEQQISNKLTLTYISNLNQSQQEVIQFQYDVNKTVSVQGVRDQNGVVSFDLLFRVRKK